MAHTVKSMILDLSGKKKTPLHGRVSEVHDDEGSVTPEEKIVMKE